MLDNSFFELLEGNEFKFIGIVVTILLTAYALKTSYSFYRNHKLEQALGLSGMNDIDVMEGFEFEEYLKVLFRKLGYKTQVTRKTGDFGADLIFKGKKKIIVQAKRYKSNVGLDAVREAYSAQAYYKADESWVITNSRFTKQALDLAKACNVKMLDRSDLEKFIVKINPEEKPINFIN